MKNNLIYLLVLVALLPVILLRDYTPDNELRYLSIVDEALQNGTFFTFTNQGEMYADKPPLYFWIIMLGKYLLEAHHMWFLSLFSLIPAFVIVYTMDKWSNAKIAKEYRLTGKLLLLSCGLFLGLAIILRMDMLMAMFIVLALRTFYRMLKEKGCQRLNSILFPVYLFLAVFSKGPVGILVPLLSTCAFLLFTRRISSLGRYWGWRTWGILLLGCLAWFGCVYAEGGTPYLNNLLFHQTIDRAVNSFHHERPFYYYFISIWYSLLPWSVLLIGVIAVAAWRRQIHSELQKFFLTILITTFLMLSLVSSKIDVYLLPTYPFFVYLAVMKLSHYKWNRWLALSVAIPAIIFGVALPALICLAQQDGTRFLGQTLFYLGGGILTISGLISLYFLYHRKQINKAINTLTCGLFCAVFAGGWALPNINNELGYGELCRTALQISEEKHLSGYHVWNISRPENMDVYLKEDIQVVTREEITSGKLHDTILMLPAKEIESLKEIAPGKASYIVGPYGIVVL